MDEQNWRDEDGWMILCVWKVELWDIRFKVSEDRTRAPYLFQGSGFLRAWGWLSQYTGGTSIYIAYSEVLLISTS